MGVLEGKVALITGAARGIGAAFVRAFAQEGARVAINFRSSKDEAERLAKEVSGLAVRGDVSRSTQVRRVFAAVEREFGGLDILVNNASYTSPHAWQVPLARLDFDEWDRTMAVDVKGTMLCCRAAEPFMRKRGGGRIVNMTSSAALKGDDTLLLYVGAKAAIHGLTAALARHLAPKIQVNAIAPGSIDTGWLRELSPKDRKSLLDSIPLGRIGTPDQVARAAVYLVSPAASFVTGHTLFVDGGALS